MPPLLTITAETGKAYAPFLRRQIRRAIPLIRGCRLRELDIALVGERRMSELHQEFLGVRGPTDVLSFPLEKNSGEVIVCVPVAKKQAKTRGIPARFELLLYCLHGMLHLCGYDDKTAVGFRKMHRLEDEILTKLGVGAVFDKRQAAGAAR
jgi:probable rRNA maturation factor